MKTESKKLTFILAYMGVCELQNGSLGNTYLVLPSDWMESAFTFPNGIDAAPSEIVKIFKGAFPSGLDVGSVITVDYEQNNKEGSSISVSPGTAKIIGGVPDDIAASWQAKHSATRLAHTHKKNMRQVAGRGKKQLMLQLDAIRCYYQEMLNIDQRAMFLAQVIAHITKWKDKP